MALRSKTALGLLFLMGLFATAAAVDWVANDVRDQRVALRSRGVETIANDVAARVDAALKATERVGHVADRIWPTVDEYEVWWASYAPNIPGNTTAALVLEVPSEDLEQFVAAERQINPDFVVTFLNEDPPNGAHLLSMRSGGSDIPLGIDLSSSPDGGDRLLKLAKGQLHLINADIRAPIAEPGDLQTIRRITTSGPEGQQRQGWSVVQVDLPRILEDAVTAADGDFGVTFEMIGIGPGGTYGIGQFGNIETVDRTIDAGDIQLAMSVWHDSSAIRSSDTRQTAAVGFASTAVLTMFGYLFLSLQANRRRAKKGESDARQDPLTGLANRRWVTEHLSSLVGEPVAVLFCDLDRFKVVNDSAGHAAGDQLLVEVGSRIASMLDANARLARFGGDEFLIVCSDDANSDADIGAHAEAVATLVRSAMEEPFEISGNEFRATLSVGIATSDRMKTGQSDELIRAADVALGRCKEFGRNGIVRYDDRLRESELDRLELERDLQIALDERDLIMHYQPIVDRQQRPVSYEALVRWMRNGELMAPDTFLPVVEEIGRMSDLGDIVLEIAIADFAAGIDPDSSTTLHINVDAAQLADPAFADRVHTVLQSNRLDPSRLVLELTEGEWAASIESIETVLEALGELGVRLAIDDFGTGHSSLSRALDVKALAEVKLDRSVIRQLFDHRNHAFFSGLTNTLIDIGVTVIAEGIETVEDLRCTEAAGILLFQGYMFARPAPAAETNFARTEPLGPTVTNDRAEIRTSMPGALFR